jgi:hypothetical protein
MNNQTTTTTTTSNTATTNSADRELDTKLYCLCRAPDDGTFMLACDRCSEWYDTLTLTLTHTHTHAHRAKSANFHRSLAGSTAVACM